LLEPSSVHAPVLLLLTVRTVPPGLARSGPPPGSAPYPHVNQASDRMIFLPKRCCRLGDPTLREPPCSCCYVTLRHCTTCVSSQLTLGQRLDAISSVGVLPQCYVSGLVRDKMTAFSVQRTA